MLNKEEIEKAKEIVKSIPNRHMDILISEDISISEVLNYIEQLETREQKLIDKLEEDINVDKARWYNEAQLYGEIFRAIKRVFKRRLANRKEYAQEILSMIKED